MYSYNRSRSLARELYVCETQSRKKSGTGAMTAKHLQ